MRHAPSHFYDFGPFRVDAVQRLLFRDGAPIPLTPKAFDTLLMLIRNSGRILGKEELLKGIWPDTFVEEATLAQNVFTLRKALGGSEGNQYIQTIPKRGYRFVASVTEVKDRTSDVRADKPDRTPPAVPPVETGERDRTVYSVAILPLNDSTSDPRTKHLGEGITESVINSLSLLPDLQVKACSAVLHYKGREVNPQETGRELGVGAMLVGNILQVAEDVIVRVEFVDTVNGWQMWGEEYSEKVSEINRLQGAIAADITKNLRLNLSKAKWQRVVNSRTHSAEAYQLYLKGRYFLNQRTDRGYKTAIDSFEHAIELDSNFALAHSGLADSYILYDFYGLVPPWETVPKARAAAVRAVELDDGLAEAHTSLASIKLIHDRDVISSEREFKRAIRLNPKYARAHDGYAHCLTAMGRGEEALAQCRLALELDPHDLEINQHLGWYHLAARQYERAIEQLQKTLAMGPDYFRARLLLGIAYGQKGAFPQAITELLRASRLEKTPVLSGFLGYSYAMAGDAKALEVLAALLEEARHSYVPPYSIAIIYLGLGDRDKALEWLERAFVEHSRWRGWLELTPELDCLRGDPRLIEIVQRSFMRDQF